MNETLTVCEVCGVTRNGDPFDHLAEDHPDRLFKMVADPQSGVTTIIEELPEPDADAPVAAHIEL